MLPAQLNATSFAHYPAQAQAVAVSRLGLLRQLPLVFLPSLLRELIDYDWKFPAERSMLDRELAYLGTLGTAALADCFAAFARIQLSPEQTSFDWCGRPHDFTEQLSAYLWRTHQMSAFREAATAYGNRLSGKVPAPPLALPRLGLAVIGQGAPPHGNMRLFQKLRAHGTLFTQVDPTGGLEALLAAVETRARLHPAPYGHWYVEGGMPEAHSEAVTGVSYGALGPARAALFDFIQRQVSRPGMGPEELRDRLAHLGPAQLGLQDGSLVDRFQVKVLTEGSGTQIFSTTFAQWATREALRRAEPTTLLVRFAPRQRQRPMNELLAGDEGVPQLDAEGSLVDADMAAYYQWINQQRLPGAAQAGFLVWLEGQSQAMAIGPSLPRGTESGSAIGLGKLVELVTG